MLAMETNLGSLMTRRQASVNPASYPDEIFDLFSIPAFDKNEPDIIPGSEIGSTKKAVEPGDVLLSRIVPHIRRAWVVPKRNGKRQIASSEWIVFRGKEFFPQYLRHYLTSDQFHAQFMNTVAGVGGSLLRARPDQVANISITLPTLEEQKRIAAILDKADAIRRQREESLQLVRDFVPALFAKKFGDPVRNPYKWPDVAIEQFVKAFEGGKNIATDDVPSDDTKYFILKVSAVTWDEFNPNEVKPVPSDFAPPVSYFVKQGDLLFSRANTTQLVGACVYVFETPDNLILPDKLWRVKLSEPRKANLLYLRYAFGHPAIQAEIGKRASGTSGSMKNISMAKMMALEIPLPPVGLQDEFASIVMRHRQLVTKCTSALHASDNLFNSLVQRAFKGEL